MRLRVALVTTGLETGGAEAVLADLVERLPDRGIDGSVISLTGRGAHADRIEAAGFPVLGLEMDRAPGARDLWRLRRTLRSAKPDVVQTWLLHANIIGGLLAARVPVVWGVHMSGALAETYGRRTTALQRLERALSRRVPNFVVAVSHNARHELLDSGYDPDKVALIPNGFDTERFRPDAAQGRRVRAELGLPPDVPLVGHFARYHPVKDHANLLGAVPGVLERIPDARFLLCGERVTPDNRSLAEKLEGLGAAVQLLGRRSDVPRLLRAIDVCVSSSASEAMPVVIGEAMATEIPFVATDVADAKSVIGETGKIVPPRDPGALGDAIADLLDMPSDARRQLGAAARHRIVERYPLDGMVKRYVEVWRRLARTDDYRAAADGGGVRD